MTETPGIYNLGVPRPQPSASFDIDDQIYPLLACAFPEHEPGEVLGILEDRKGSCGIDNPSEFEQEIWEEYLRLKAEILGSNSAAS